MPVANLHHYAQLFTANPRKSPAVFLAFDLNSWAGVMKITKTQILLGIVFQQHLRLADLQ